MKRFRLFLGGLICLFGLMWAHPARACPNCQEAIASSANAASDPAREPRAYNHSIYLMAGMPYLLLGLLGFKIYKDVRKSNTHMQAMIESLEKSSDSDPSA
jgi:hypothetical protein